MKTIVTLLASLFLGTIILFAQQPITKEFGKISLADFDYEYAEDSTAEAIILFDIGDTDFIEARDGNGYNVRFFREKRILIKKKAGLDYANISIPFYVERKGPSERISDIEATTYYVENGSLKKKTLSKKEIFSEKSTENWHQKKFAFPNAIEGAIIEYKYTLHSPFIFQLPDWQFQSTIPTAYSQYKFNLIPFYEYVYLLQGANKFDSFTSKKGKGLPRYYGGISFYDVEYNAVMTNVPAFKDESYITSIDDYIMKIDFQLAGVTNLDGTKREILTTYPKLIKALNEEANFGKYLKKAEKEAKRILSKSIDLTNKNELEKAKTIINYLKNTYDWDGKNRKYAQNSPKEVIKQKKGNAAEINLLLVAFLRAAGIEVSPVIFSTRSHGKINRDYPFSHNFNSVIAFVEVGDKKFLTDATEPLIPYDRIPLRCMNDQGLVVKEGKPIWVNMYSNINSQSTRRIKLTPNPEEGHLEAVIQNSYTEVDAYIYRSVYENSAEKIKKELSEEGFEEITQLKTENYDAKNKLYKINFVAQTPLEGFDDKLLISPFLQYPPQENLLKQKERTYPVDFIYKRSTSYGSQITIPEGYQAVDLPENLSIDNNLVKIMYNVDKQDNAIKVTGAIFYKKAVYQPADYKRIKRDLDIIVEKFNEQILLEKI